jgi:hypothetical protein
MLDNAISVEDYLLLHRAFSLEQSSQIHQAERVGAAALQKRISRTHHIPERRGNDGRVLVKLHIAVLERVVGLAEAQRFAENMSGEDWLHERSNFALHDAWADWSAASAPAKGKHCLGRRLCLVWFGRGTAATSHNQPAFVNRFAFEKLQKVIKSYEKLQKVIKSYGKLQKSYKKL